MKNLLVLIVIMCCTCLATRNAVTATIYQWTDAEGVVHFSDVLPANHTADGTREIVLEDINDSSTSEERYSIIEQANLMAEWRQQTTAERLALKQLYFEEKRLTRELELQRQESLARIQDYQYRPHYYVFPQPFFNPRRHFHEGGEEQPDRPHVQQSFMRPISRPEQQQAGPGYIKARTGFYSAPL